MASADKCHHAVSFLQYVPDQNPGLPHMYPSCVACLQSNYILDTLGVVEPGKLFLSCLSQENLLQIDLRALKEHGKALTFEWGEEMGNPRKLQERGIGAGVSSNLFQWHYPSRVFNSQWAALSWASESVLYSTPRYIYSPFSVTAAFVKLPGDKMGWQIYSKDCTTT